MRKFFIIFLIIFYCLNQSAISIDLPKYYQFPEKYIKGDFHETTKDFFLVSTELMKDPRFKNTVIVMLEHDEKGALGVVINKPLGKFNIKSLLEDSNIKGIDKSKLINHETFIYSGGPLDQNRIFIIHSKDYKNSNTKFYKNFSVANDYKTLADIAEKKGPKDSLIILGISAWTTGQLEGEIDQGSWNLSEINQDILFQENNQKKHIMATDLSFLRL